MDNATFDRLARMLAGGASRRHTLRAFIAAALAGGTAEELLAAKKDRKKNDNDKKLDGDKDRKDRDNKGRGSGGSYRVAAQGKNNKKKRKRKNKRKPNTGGDSGGNSCAGTPLRPGQDFLGCDFSGRNLRGQDLNSSLFKDVDLTDADLCGANLESASVADSDLSDANLTDVTLDSSSHSKTSFAGANLTNATLRVATFSKVDFSNADLTGADLTGAAFADADFTGAIFCRTIQPNGNVDDRDCDVCDNTCGLCEDCEDEDCTPPDCCPNPEGPGGVCVDTDTDPLHCGGCDVPCFDNLANACVDGECVCGNGPKCSNLRTCCPGEEGDAASCKNLNNDTLNCGECGKACLVPVNPCLSVVCQNGQCVEVPAENGSPCVSGGEGVCCADGNSSTCVVGARCCTQAQCNANQDCCDGQCVNTNTDRENCGACEVICEFPENPCRGVACVNGSCQESNLSDGTDCEFLENSGVCCGGSCAFGDECCSNADCGSGNSCCGGQCFNTTTNFDRCGSCTNVCPEGRATACIGGECVCGSSSVCAENEFCCPDGCFNLDTNFGHCGTCGIACLATRANKCTDGQCRCGSGSQCGETETCCNDQCVDTSTDVDNCGTCGNACDPPLNSCNVVLCLEGTCNNFAEPDDTECVEGQEDGVCCFDGSAAVCVAGGQCCSDSGCDDVFNCCDNQCVDTNSDFDHCGICGNACEPGKADACFNGQCVCGSEFECSETETCCSNVCIDTDSDRFNCGACGVECVGGVCSAGACIDCEGGVPCGSACLPAGPHVCCTVADCVPQGLCRIPVGCGDDHVCLYGDKEDGVLCGCGGACQGGICVGGEC